MNKYLLFFMIMVLPTLIIISIITIYSVNALSISTIDNSGRREYTYCPLSDSDVKSFGGEIDGCPIARVYVNNWNSLTPTQQTTIDTLLRSKGFVDSSEHIIK